MTKAAGRTRPDSDATHLLRLLDAERQVIEALMAVAPERRTAVFRAAAAFLDGAEARLLEASNG